MAMITQSERRIGDRDACRDWQALGILDFDEHGHRYPTTKP